MDDSAEFEARIAELRVSRAELVAGMAHIPGITAIPSDGNFVLADVSALGVSAERFVDAVRTEGFLLRSLSVHHANRSYVRVTVGTPTQNARCLAAIERIAASIRTPVATTYGYWATAGDAE